MSNEIITTADATLGLSSESDFSFTQRVAKMFNKSMFVPAEYRGEANFANCVIAVTMAARIKADPMMTMQNLVIIHGKPSWSSQFLIATFNTCGKYESLNYEFTGIPNTDSFGCRASAVDKTTGEKLVGSEVTVAIAKAEGWYGKNGSKWKTMPEQMLRYRAAAWFIRAYAPEVSLGIHTVEENLDIIDINEKRQETPKSRKVDDLVKDATPEIIEGEIVELQQESPHIATNDHTHEELVETTQRKANKIKPKVQIEIVESEPEFPFFELSEETEEI